MEFIIITISNLLWVAYSIFEGMRESIHKANEESSRREINLDIDKISNIQRLIVISSISVFMIHMIGYHSIPFIIGQLLMFNYFKSLSASCTYRKIKSKKVVANINKNKKNMIFFGIIFQIITYLIIY